MAIDRRHVGYTFPPFTLVADRVRVERFAEAIGMPLGGDGMVPPTFMKAIEGEHDSSRAILSTLGVDLKRVLHAEQQFDYLLPIRVGDRLEVTRRVTDISDKKGGALEFITIESTFQTEDSRIAGRSRQLILVRHPVAREAS
jgi:hypothetical protein